MRCGECTGKVEFIFRDLWFCPHCSECFGEELKLEAQIDKEFSDENSVSSQLNEVLPDSVFS